MQALADHRLGNLLLEQVLLEPLLQRLKLLVELRLPFLALLAAQVEAVLGDVLELLAIKVGNGADGVLVDGVRQVEHLVALLQEALHKGRGGHLGDARPGDVVDGPLLLLHSLHVRLQAGELVERGRGAEAKELREASSVRRVLNDAQLDVGAVLLPEGLVIGLADLLQHVQHLADQLLANHLQQLVLLQHLSTDVQRKVVRVH